MEKRVLISQEEQLLKYRIIDPDRKPFLNLRIWRNVRLVYDSQVQLSRKIFAHFRNDVRFAMHDDAVKSFDWREEIELRIEQDVVVKLQLKLACGFESALDTRLVNSG